MKKVYKKYFIRNLILFLAMLMLLFQMIEYSKSKAYYPDMKSAILEQKNIKNIKKIEIVKGKEGLIYIGLTNGEFVDACSFNIKTANNIKYYQVNKNVSFSVVSILHNINNIEDRYMIKLSTAKGSKEEIAIGKGLKLAEKYQQLTGINPIYINFKYHGQIKTIWYIISKDGLDKLPDLQMRYKTVDKIP